MADKDQTVGSLGIVQRWKDLTGGIHARLFAAVLQANSGVDIGDVDVTSIITGTGATNLGKAEDAAHASGDTGVMLLAVRDDTLASYSGAENDYEPLHTDADGALWAHIRGGVDPGIGATDLGKGEDAAHTSGDTGVMALGVRKDTAAALAGTDGDYQPAIFDASGRLHVSQSDVTKVASALVVSPRAKFSTEGDMPLEVEAVTSGRHALRVTLFGSETGHSVPDQQGSAAGDASFYGLVVDARNRLYNGGSFDQQRNNVKATILASAARTATVSSADQTNYNARGVKVFVDVTAIADTPSIVVTIEEQDPVSGGYRTILTAAAITGTGLTVLTVYPGVTVAANVAVSEPLSRTWRVTVTHADADSITYSVGANLIL